MSLNTGAEGPAIHAIRPDADSPAPPARDDRNNLVETIEQPGPLPGLDLPFDLRAIRSELGGGEPALEIFERLFPLGGLRLDARKAVASLGEKVRHAEIVC